MALERVPADIRKDGGVARMSDPKVINRHDFIQILFSYQLKFSLVSFISINSLLNI